ncbi:MAG: Double zinc ribbon [Methanobacterium sp. PtaU1.Bin097]|jgi:hypothetical protein|nr:MAG: Double zinc ribbon [Methanobacterium sp. PtaU1.Bin097]
MNLKCVECGAENPGNAKFCEECGKKLPGTEIIFKNQPEKTPNKNRNLMLIAMIGLVIVIGLVGYTGLKIPNNSVLTLNNTSAVNNSSSNQVNPNNPDVKVQRQVCTVCNGKGSYRCPTCAGYLGMISCDNCGGTGVVGNPPHTCPTCGGDKYVTCPTCHGSGELTCKFCKGDGYVDSGDPGQ